jgi:hypothetical protein
MTREGTEGRDQKADDDFEMNPNTNPVPGY